MEWGKLVTLTGSTQVVIQAIGFISGILIIRLLPTQEYAFYTLANTMLGTMTILADGGISTGVMAQGGKVWQEREKLGRVLSTGMELKKRFAVGSLLIAMPALVFLLRYHEASWLMTLLIVASLIPTFFSSLTGSLLQIPLKLKQDIQPLQHNQIKINVSRLILLLTTIFIFPWAYIAVLSAGIPQVWGNFQLRKFASRHVNFTQNSDPLVRKKIMDFVHNLLPSSIYYCLSGQITIWLISLFGSTEALAQIGALSRLSMILSIFNILFSTLVVPRFSRLPNQKKQVLKFFFLIQMGLIVGCFCIVFFVHSFSENILWILGDDFSSLSTEIILITVGSCFALISGCTNHLLSSRGIIVPPAHFIITMITVQVLLALIIPIDNVIGIIIYGLCTSGMVYLVRLSYLFIILKKNVLFKKDQEFL